MNTKDLKKTKWQYTSTFGTCYCIIFLKIVFIWFYYKLMKVCYIILYTVWYQIIKLIYYLYMFHKILFNFYKTNIHHIQCTITIINVFIYSFTGLLDDKYHFESI